MYPNQCKNGEQQKQAHCVCNNNINSNKRSLYRLY